MTVHDLDILAIYFCLFNYLLVQLVYSKCYINIKNGLQLYHLLQELPQKINTKVPQIITTKPLSQNNNLLQKVTHEFTTKINNLLKKLPQK